MQNTNFRTKIYLRLFLSVTENIDIDARGSLLSAAGLAQNLLYVYNLYRKFKVLFLLQHAQPEFSHTMSFVHIPK